jgi:hypothetical protein
MRSFIAIVTVLLLRKQRNTEERIIANGEIKRELCTCYILPREAVELTGSSRCQISTHKTVYVST